jgi:hypothetical protein
MSDGCRAEAARTELDAAFTQHKREAAAAVQEARGQGTTVATRATRLESELSALRTSEAAALQRATAAEARSRELSLVRPCRVVVMSLVKCGVDINSAVVAILDGAQAGQQMGGELESLRKAHEALRTDSLQVRNHGPAARSPLQCRLLSSA